MGSRRRETEPLAIHQRRQRCYYDRIWFDRRVHFHGDLQRTYLDGRQHGLVIFDTLVGSSEHRHGCQTEGRLIDPQQKPREAECRLLAKSCRGRGPSMLR